MPILPTIAENVARLLTRWNAGNADDRAELRYYGGLSNAEMAETLGVAERTVKRDWQVARAWLYAQMHRNNSDAG